MAPVFPLPVRTFAGRHGELERILAHVEDETLFLVYGVGGIGKSELAYQVVRALRARPRWADAPAILVDVRPGMSASRVLAQLLPAVGAARARRRGRLSEDAHLLEQLEQLARLLDARPHLLFIDDVHHLEDTQVADALGYLSRRVQASRILVASRRQLALPPDAPPPVVTTLGPLDAAAATEMMTALADRLELPRADPEHLMRVTHGSPFHIHRFLTGTAPESSLDETVGELAPPARRLLLALAVLAHRPSLDAVRRAWDGGATLDTIVRDLGQRFLLTLEQDELVVHDLIREAVLATAARAELAAAHVDAAALCTVLLRDEARAPAVLAVDAADHLLAADRAADAWAVIERWYSALAAAASEHLLAGPLARLRDALPERRVAIDLLVARALVRGSRIEEASRVLAGIDATRTAAEDARHALIAGEIAQGAGDLAQATAQFERAVERAPDRDLRFGARLRVASAAMFAGDGARARQELADALAELPAPTPRQRARAAWALTASWMFDERYELAAAEARRARAELPGTGLDDLANQLAMLETLACIEHGDMAHARAAARAIDEAGLRRQVAVLYRAIGRYADGEAKDASATLVAAHERLRQQGDLVNAYLAGYYGSAALAEVGSLREAMTLAEATARLADRNGWRGPVTRSLAQEAMLASEALQPDAARSLARAALASRHVAARSAMRAHCALSRAATIEGDLVLALGHLTHARAAVTAPDLAVAQTAVDLEHAAIELVGGDFDGAIERGERVLERQGGRARPHDAAHARLVLAAACAARGRRTDLLRAQTVLAEARDLADAGALRALQVGCAIIAAALARREHRERAARDLLAEALRQLDPERGSIYAGTLVAAIDGGIAARAVPGALALLAHLGFSDTVDVYLVDRGGRRAALDHELGRERAVRDLFVDETRSIIVARQGTREIGGRPLLCALLSVLVQARGAAVEPETIYTRAWGVARYHPLQHRNALYVAINRLRACLRELLPDREVVERADRGWRLAEDIDACVAVPASSRPRTEPAPQKTM